MDPFNSELFIIYTPEEYLQSERKEMDEIYRIGEKVLIHKTSGLRIEYVTTESYYGDEYTYRLKSIFIISRQCEKLQVTEADFNQEIFTTPKGMIPFSEVSLKRLP